MTVAQLIQALSTQSPNATVIVIAEEAGPADVSDVQASAERPTQIVYLGTQD